MNFLMGMTALLSLLWVVGFVIGAMNNIDESLMKHFNLGILVCLAILSIGMVSTASTELALSAVASAQQPTQEFIEPK